MTLAHPIYVDLDDVLSETIGALTRLLSDEWNRHVAVDDVRHFDLGRSFGLAPEELEAFMRRAHEPDFLDAIPPRDGAAEVLAEWRERGYHVAIMTGRPPASAEISRSWLDRHGIPHASFVCVDKYSRQHWADPAGLALSKTALGELEFTLAVEDSLEMAAHLVEHCGVAVALMDRPWNHDLAQLPHETASAIAGCLDWREVAERFASP